MVGRRTGRGNRPFTGVGPVGGLNNKFAGSFGNLPTRNSAAQAGMSRAISACVLQNPKLQRYEEITMRMKKLSENEKRNLRNIKTMVANEIENRNFLEKMLR